MIFTIGHSNLPLDQFIAVLKTHGVELVVDVRKIPRSRHNPQFNRETLAPKLRNHRIGYRHFKHLGGLRHPRRDSIHTGWRTAGFRGYADYMETAEFERYLRRLIELAGQKRTAILCAEAVPWRCHRWLIADALTVRGVTVEHITSLAHRQRHRLTPFARVNGTTLSYPGPQQDLPGLANALQ